MNEKEILIGFTVDKADFNALRAYFMYKRTPTRTKSMVCLLLASLLLLILSESAFAFPYFKPIGLCGMLIIVGIYSWISMEARRLEKGVQELIGKKQETRLTGEGFTVKWKGSSRFEEYFWDEIDYVFEDESYFFLFIDRYSVIIISKLELKLEKKDYRIKEIHELIKSHTKLISDLKDFEYQKI